MRCDADKRQEKTGFKIREAQLSKVPYMLIIGDKEQEEGTVAVRRRDTNVTETMKVEDFPYLENFIGKTLIVTDGTTLLGADDKSGVAEIITLAARLSLAGLPCPNLSTGGDNYHSRYEFIPLEDMECMVDVLTELASQLAGKEKV